MPRKVKATPFNTDTEGKAIPVPMPANTLEQILNELRKLR